MVAELKMACNNHLIQTHHRFEMITPINVTSAIQQRVKVLAAQQELLTLGTKIKEEFQQVFLEFPHIEELLTDVYCRIKLKNASKSMQTCTYNTPCKYHEAWAILIKQHLDVGHIRPLSSQHASLAFLVPKTDMVVLP